MVRETTGLVALGSAFRSSLSRVLADLAWRLSNGRETLFSVFVLVLLSLPSLGTGGVDGLSLPLLLLTMVASLWLELGRWERKDGASLPSLVGLVAEKDSP